jgi:hypothetical protein
MLTSPLPALPCRFFAAELYRAGERAPQLRRECGGEAAARGGAHAPCWWSGGPAAIPSSVAAARRDFVGVCRSEHLSFTSLTGADAVHASELREISDIAITPNL